MPKRYVPDNLTPTEQAVEGMLRRDPIRKMSDAQLEQELQDCAYLSRLYSGTKEGWRCQELWDRARRLRDEQARRRAVA